MALPYIEYAGSFLDLQEPMMEPCPKPHFLKITLNVIHPYTPGSLVVYSWHIFNNLIAVEIGRLLWHPFTINHFRFFIIVGCVKVLRYRCFSGIKEILYTVFEITKRGISNTYL
jgi:hypothetical protein